MDNNSYGCESRRRPKSGLIYETDMRTPKSQRIEMKVRYGGNRDEVALRETGVRHLIPLCDTF